MKKPSDRFSRARQLFVAGSMPTRQRRTASYESFTIETETVGRCPPTDSSMFSSIFILQRSGENQKDLFSNSLVHIEKVEDWVSLSTFQFIKPMQNY